MNKELERMLRAKIAEKNDEIVHWKAEAKRLQAVVDKRQEDDRKQEIDYLEARATGTSNHDSQTAAMLVPRADYDNLKDQLYQERRNRQLHHENHPQLPYALMVFLHYIFLQKFLADF